MTESSKKLVVAVLCALFLSVVVLLYSTDKLQDLGNASAPPPRDLSSHPLHSKYNFAASIAIPAEAPLNGKGEWRKEYGFLKKLGEIFTASSWQQVQASFGLEIVEVITVNSQKFLLGKFAYGY